MTDEHGFLDSHAPYDGEVCTADPWPLPAVKPWNPQPSLWARIVAWVKGLA